MEIIYIVIGTGGGSLIGWLLSYFLTAGKYVNRIDNLEKFSHKAPCQDISEIKEDLAEIKTNIKWLIDKNGGRKNE